MTSIDGFARRETAEGELWLAHGFEQAAEELGLDSQSGWERHLAAGVRAGRGNVAFVDTSAGRLVLKQLRRGGVAGPLWGERFPSRRRLLENLTLPSLARERGVRTPAASCLLLIASGPGLWRGWLAIEAVTGGESFVDRLRERPPGHDDWTAALEAVRALHDAGIEHPDLNLGNLLFDPEGAVWILDLDRSRVHGEGLDDDARIDGIRRVERSYHKSCFRKGLEPEAGIDWLAAYGEGDPSLNARWEQRRDRDQARLKRHRRGWKRLSL